MNLSEAIESAKNSAKSNNQILTQDFFNYLYDSLSPSERSVFVTTLAEMGINTRRGSESIRAFVENGSRLFGEKIEDPFSESKEHLDKEARNRILLERLRNSKQK